MIRELAAIPLPASAESTSFWQGVERGMVTLPRCPVCKRWQWYPKPTGSCCGATEFEWVDLPGTGSVFTYTVVHRPFLAELSAALPLTVALITLDGAEEVRFVGTLAIDQPSVGQRVRLRVERGADRPVPVFCADDDD